MTNQPAHIGWISGMPRSGTTWISQIFASSPQVRLKFCPLFSYEFKNALDETASGDDWQRLFEAAYQTRSEFLDQDYLRKSGLVPTFARKDAAPSHLVVKSTRFHNLMPGLLARHPTIRVLHLVRDPRAAIHSWLTNPHEFPADADPETEWRSGRCRKDGPGEFWGFDDWMAVNEQALTLERDYPDRFKVVQYEDIVPEPLDQITRIFRFFGLEVGEQTEAFIAASRTTDNAHKRSVYKNPTRVGDWKRSIHPVIADACLHDVTGTPLARFLRE